MLLHDYDSNYVSIIEAKITYGHSYGKKQQALPG